MTEQTGGLDSSKEVPPKGAFIARVARVLQQLRSVSDLHARELEQLADQLQAAGQAELADRLRTFRGLHADELGVAIVELADMLGEPTPETRTPEESPKRAKWLEEQEEKPQPLTRRELLNLGGENEPG